MQVEYSPTFVIRANSQEFSLITRALSGVLKDAERPDALKLCHTIVYSRHQRNIEQGEVSAKALAAVEKLLPEEVIRAITPV